MTECCAQCKLDVTANGRLIVGCQSDRLVLFFEVVHEHCESQRSNFLHVISDGGTHKAFDLGRLRRDSEFRAAMLARYRWTRADRAELTQLLRVASERRPKRRAS